MTSLLNRLKHPGAALCVAATLGITAAGTASAQSASDYPNRPITMVVPFGPGSVTDLLARIAANEIGSALNTSVVVQNKPGAGGNIGAGDVARAAPDGYTLLVGPTSTNAVNPSLYKNLTFDALKDFAPISNIAKVPNVLVVPADSPANSVSELIALGKKNQLSYASGGTGGSMHLAAELFANMAGIDILHVPYKGGGPALADLLPGRVDMMFCNLPLCLPHIESGKLKALGVTSAQPSPLLPKVKPVGDQGLSGFEVTGWFGLFAPAKVDPAIIAKLNKALTQSLEKETVKQQLLAQGAEPDASTPEQFNQFVKAEYEKWADVIKKANITVE